MYLNLVIDTDRGGRDKTMTDKHGTHESTEAQWLDSLLGTDSETENLLLEYERRAEGNKVLVRSEAPQFWSTVNQDLRRYTASANQRVGNNPIKKLTITSVPTDGPNVLIIETGRSPKWILDARLRPEEKKIQCLLTETRETSGSPIDLESETLFFIVRNGDLYVYSRSDPKKLLDATTASRKIFALLIEQRRQDG